jgi:hypothetical protein
MLEELIVAQLANKFYGLLWHLIVHKPYFICLDRVKEPVQIQGPLGRFNMLLCSERLLALRSTYQARQPPLVGSPRLLNIFVATLHIWGRPFHS